MGVHGTENKNEFFNESMGVQRICKKKSKLKIDNFCSPLKKIHTHFISPAAKKTH